MKLLIAALLVLAGAVSLALLAQQDPGYVLMSRGQWSVELTLSLFVVLLVLAFALSYALVRLLLGTWHLPTSTREWRRRARARRARATSNQGLIELAEGHWAAAERDLIRHARDSDIPLLNYLSAARAAQKLKAPERRDKYLLLAHQSMPKAEFAVAVTQAELQLTHGQLEQALATLIHLRSLAPKHPHVLLLLARLYTHLRAWSDLVALLPELRKRKVLEETELALLERHAYRGLLASAVEDGRAERLEQTWAAMPKTLRRDPDLACAYARQLLHAQAGRQAEAVLRETLTRTWDERCAGLYGLVAGEDAGKQLAQAEAWLKSQQHSPALLLSLGRLAARSGLWGKARAYLEASVGMEPRADTYQELARVLEQAGEDEAALDCYREGLRLATEPTRAVSLDQTPERTALPAPELEPFQRLAAPRV